MEKNQRPIIQKKDTGREEVRRIPKEKKNICIVFFVCEWEIERKEIEGKAIKIYGKAQESVFFLPFLYLSLADRFQIHFLIPGLNRENLE